MKPAVRPVAFLCVVFGSVLIVVGISRWTTAKDIIPWREDFTSAVAEASKNNKPLLLYFTASWCEPCQKLRQTTWANQEVASALREFVPVRIDVDENSTLALKYNVEEIPRFIILKSDEKILKSIAGYLGPKEFLEWLKR